ncbi:hypothetical protein D3C77_745050 [compost metagenome]
MQLFQQQQHCLLANLEAGLCHGGQRWIAILCQLDIVKADNRQILRYPQAQLFRLGQYADRHDVAVTKDRRWRFRQCHQ